MNYTDTVGMVTDYAILWVCFICRFIPSFLKNVIFVAYLQQQRQFKRADISPFVYVTDRMAVPPAYSDLGKAAKDVFSKGYGEETHSVLEKLSALKTSCILLYLMSLICL